MAHRLGVAANWRMKSVPVVMYFFASKSDYYHARDQLWMALTTPGTQMFCAERPTTERNGANGEYITCAGIIFKLECAVPI